VLADGAYERASCRQDLLKRGIECFIPPIRKGRKKKWSRVKLREIVI
jgi:hypothetical protein